MSAEIQSSSQPDPLSTSVAASRKGVFISTYGCQMNVNDTERMYSLLEMANYEPVSSPDQASLIIINSCSVREKPVHKVFSEVGKYRKLKDKNDKLKIAVGGCVAQQEKARLMIDQPLIDFVFGTDAIDLLPDLIGRAENAGPKEKIVSAKFEHDKPYQIQTLIRNPGVAAFVNITKGCDNFCTFCVVPFTRGRERSRSMREILEDVNSFVQRGVKEVTLLGQNVNSYESDCGADFEKLLETLATTTEIERIRYTTPHPKDFDESLMAMMHKHREKIMEYVHLPAQAGNSEVLERMNRGYTREEYIKKAHMILNTLPGAVLSTDMIVGFPGETEEQFQDTLSLLDEVPFENIFAFKYSPRPFTKAANFGDQVPEEVKKDRLARLLEKNREISFKLAEKYVGQTLKVLVERFDSDNGRCYGRSTGNKLVHFPGSPELTAKTVNVKIKEAFPQTLMGILA